MSDLLHRDRRRMDLMRALQNASLGDRYPLPPNIGRMSLDEVRVEIAQIVAETIRELEIRPAPFFIQCIDTCPPTP